jgi:hypothetical protein
MLHHDFFPLRRNKSSRCSHEKKINDFTSMRREKFCWFFHKKGRGNFFYSSFNPYLKLLLDHINRRNMPNHLKSFSAIITEHTGIYGHLRLWNSFYVKCSYDSIKMFIVLTPRRKWLHKKSSKLTQSCIIVDYVDVDVLLEFYKYFGGLKRISLVI